MQNVPQKNRARISPWFAWLFPIPFVIAGAVTLTLGVRSLWFARESSSWPSTSGVVIHSDVETSRGNKGTTYQAEIMYDYEVDGSTYSSNRVGYGDYGSSNPSPARQMVNRYPKGKSVTVYYQEEDPEQSCLEPGVHGRTYFLPSFGAVFFFAGLGMWIYLPRVVRKQNQNADISAV